jgi:hypothetical protein
MSLSLSSVFFNDAVSFYEERSINIYVNFIFHVLFERLILVTHLLYMHFW